MTISVLTDDNEEGWHLVGDQRIVDIPKADLVMRAKMKRTLARKRQLNVDGVVASSKNRQRGVDGVVASSSKRKRSDPSRAATSSPVAVGRELPAVLAAFTADVERMWLPLLYTM